MNELIKEEFYEGMERLSRKWECPQCATVNKSKIINFFGTCTTCKIELSTDKIIEIAIK